jgi:hypothetical protein
MQPAAHHVEHSLHPPSAIGVGSQLPQGLIQLPPALCRLGFVLAASNSLAGRLCDLSRLKGWGNTGCFLWGACACALAMLALLGFSAFGSLGRESQMATAAA